MQELTPTDFAELDHIRRNAPVHPGDTLSHVTATRLARIGLVQHSGMGDWIPGTNHKRIK